MPRRRRLAMSRTSPAAEIADDARPPRPPPPCGRARKGLDSWLADYLPNTSALLTCLCVAPASARRCGSSAGLVEALVLTDAAAAASSLRACSLACPVEAE